MMNMPLHVSEDRMMDLINALLSESDEQTTMAHLRDCALCEERFRALLRDHETARVTPAPSAWTDGSIRPPKSSPRLRRAWVIVPAAAVVAAVSLWLLSRDSATRDDYWIPMEFNESALRSADRIAVESSEAFRAYEARDAARAIELLRNTPATDDEMVSSLRRLVLASALVNTSQPSEAITELERLEIFSLPVRWRQQAQWVEYLALRDAGRTEDANSRLEKLAEYEGDIGDRARAEVQP